MTWRKREIMELALEALNACNRSDIKQVREAITALKERLAQPEQEPVAWPCHMIEADFSKKTITLRMECGDYKVAAGTHLLSTTPPQRTEQEPVAWMFLDDYERITTSETFCTVYSVEVGSATRGKTTVVLYTVPPQRTFAGSGDLEDSNAYLTPPAQPPQENT